MKKPILGDAAVHYLEVLSMRIWVSHWSDGKPSDIPQFISRDHFCSAADLAVRATSWRAICVPVKLERHGSPNEPTVELLLSPGVDGRLILSNIREVVSRGVLDSFEINQARSLTINQEFLDLVVGDSFLKSSFERGWIKLGGRTYPSLDRLFALDTQFADQILEAMQRLISSRTEITVRDDSVTAISFHPDAGFFDF